MSEAPSNKWTERIYEIRRAQDNLPNTTEGIALSLLLQCELERQHDARAAWLKKRRAEGR